MDHIDEKDTVCTVFPSAENLQVSSLGDCTVTSPLVDSATRFVNDDERVLLSAHTHVISRCREQQLENVSFEIAGPRRNLYFDPASTTCGIVTCGGLCPGLNDVIRSITLTLLSSYGVRRVLGFRYGYDGLSASPSATPITLTDEVVKDIHAMPGTILGTSRGPQDINEIVDALRANNVKILFTVGGDGTLRGASEIAKAAADRGLSLSVVGVPKTIDNDINWIDRSFGFSTAVESARDAILAAHTEARSMFNGIGLVKLMGRQSGFVAAHTALATSVANYCLVPEISFSLHGNRGLLPLLEERLLRKRHAVIIAAEGAGQDLISRDSEPQYDASGNVKLADIGAFLKQEIADYLKERGIDSGIKYIDPSYMIRSLPANSTDSEFCLILGQNAAHAGMAGKTNVVIGVWNRSFTHVPIPVVVGERKKLNPEGSIWQAVCASTHQPRQPAQ